MKCYACFSEPANDNDVYVDMLEAMIKSLLKNTTLSLTILYDGSTNRRTYKILRKYNINVVFHEFSHKMYLEQLYPEEYCLKTYGKVISYSKLSGTFMRIDIPFIEDKEEYVLYVDTDVIFLKNITLNDFPDFKYLLASPEWDKNIDNMKDFNAGILVINVKNMRERCNIILKMIRNQVKTTAGLFDQGYLNQICFRDSNLLDLKYNWKPYWGKNDEIKILHFHGVKPGANFSDSGFGMSAEAFKKFFYTNINDIVYFFYYIKIYYEYLGLCDNVWINNFIDKAIKLLYTNNCRFNLIKQYITSQIDLSKSIKFSVIVTSYNYEKYISKTIESLVNQTYQIYEIIIIDDGSSDGSVNIIESYSRKFNNIKLLQHKNGENKGLCESMRVAIKYATGDFICFCESDDYWDIYHIENLNKYLLKNKDANLIYNTIKVVNQTTDSQYDKYINDYHDFLQKNDDSNVFNCLSCNPFPTFSAVCLNKKLTENLNYDSVVPQYLDFWLWRQLCYKNKIFFCIEAISYWRKHDESYDVKCHVGDLNKFLKYSNDIINNNFKDGRNVK